MKRLQVDLVIVDNLGLVSGGIDENSNRMASVMSNWRRLAEDYRLAVILVHHQTKSYSKASGTRTGASLRGHSSIEASLDLGLLAERDGRSSIVNLIPTKIRGADVVPFAAMFTYNHKPSTSELQEARFCGVVSKTVNPNYDIEQAILRIVSEDEGINRRGIVKTVRNQLRTVGVHKITGAIEKLEETGQLSMKLGNRGAKTYFISEQEDVPEEESFSDLQPEIFLM